MLTKLARMTAIGLLLWLPGTVPSATAQSAANHVTFSQLKYVGTTSLSSSAAASVSSASSADRFRIAPLPKRPTGRAPTRSLLTVPTPPGNRVVNRGASVRFSGLNTADSASVNSNFVVTPPDQGLCVGNGFVVEAGIWLYLFTAHRESYSRGRLLSTRSFPPIFLRLSSATRDAISTFRHNAGLSRLQTLWTSTPDGAIFSLQ